MAVAGGTKVPKVTRVPKVDFDEGLACPKISEGHGKPKASGST